MRRIRATASKHRTEPKRKEILPVIRRAASAVGLSQKAMAQSAECPESEISDALNDRENRRFDAEWLWRQDDAFLLRFVEEVMEARKLTPENVRAIRRKRIIELIELLLVEAA